MLEVKNISYTRSSNANYLFRNLNFSLSEGQLVLVRGNNGAGKTTLLKIIAGLILVDKGKIQWQGQNIHQNQNYRSNISYLSHKDGLKNALSIKDNLLFDLILNTRTVFFQTIQTVLHAFEIHHNENTLCESLSAGQRRKVRLSGIILKQKKLWILDEPFTFLDKKSALTLRNYFDNHLKEGGMILMASHQAQDEAFAHHMIDLS